MLNAELRQPNPSHSIPKSHVMGTSVVKSEKHKLKLKQNAKLSREACSA